MKRLLLISKILLVSVMLVSSITLGSNNINHVGELVTMEFPPNKEVGILNPLLWKVKVTCIVKATDESDIIQAKIVKGKATLNGQDITDGKQVEVKNGDNLLITASALGSFKITNLGLNTVKTTCSLTSESMNQIYYIKSLLGEEEDELKEETLKFLEFIE
jgi:hypothetical protein